MPVGSDDAARVVPVPALTHDEVAQMLRLMQRHYQRVSAASFRADLLAKDEALLLHRAGRVVGFSTLTRTSALVDGVSVTAFFSGDTVVEREARGAAPLLRVWGDTVFTRAAHIRAADPGRRVYWLLISAGYATYRFLPLFFHAYLPALGREVPAFERRVAHELARARFGERFDADRGVVELAHPTPLRPGVADPAQRASDPHVAHFLRLNPGHAHGDELVCLTELDPGNLTRAGRRALGLRTPPQRSGETTRG